LKKRGFFFRDGAVRESRHSIRISIGTAFFRGGAFDRGSVGTAFEKRLTAVFCCLVKKILRPLDTRPAENNPIFLKAVRLHGRPPARPFGFEKTRLFLRGGVFTSRPASGLAH
jgi:hypothetical protein